MATVRAHQARAPEFIDPPGYARHRPEQRLFYQLIEQHYPKLLAARAAQGRPLPRYVQEEFEAYRKCGRLEHGFLRVRCESCHAEKLVAFSCKGRGFCPSCGARRMVESAALLVDEVLHADFLPHVLSPRASVCSACAWSCRWLSAQRRPPAAWTE